MITQITNKVFKINANSNIYIILNDEPMVIDAGDRLYHKDVINSFNKIISPDKIKYVLFTHLHYDHIGNVDLFKNANFYADKQEIECYNKSNFNTILGVNFIDQFKIKLNPFEILPENIKSQFEIIHTPGHTLGSTCFYYKQKNILFSGDTLFFNNNIGRMDLPTSRPEQMKESLNKLGKLGKFMLCPGHDY